MAEAKHNGAKSNSAADKSKPAEPVQPQDATTQAGPAAEAPLPTAAVNSAAEPPVPVDELAEIKDQLLRLRADFDNFRKRTVRDRDEHSRRANEKLLKDLLPVIDHFELGLQQARKHHVKHAVIEGLAAVFDQLQGVLARAGVEEIPAEGMPFDPQLHECVAHANSDQHPENTILSQTRRGYKLGQYLLRAAQVVVSNGPQKGHAAGQQAGHAATEGNASHSPA